MISFLFWNLAKNPQAVPYLGRIGLTYTIDVHLLAECPENVASITAELNQLHRGTYQVADAPPAKVRFISRLALPRLEMRYSSIGDDMTIWRLEGDRFPFISLAVVHLPAKMGGVTDADQLGWSTRLAEELANYENREQSQDTLLVGDLNMNPFDDGVSNVMGFHGLMTKGLTDLPDRRHRGRSFRRFYNPMWGLFGDRTPGPAGTYFWDSSVPNNQHWYMLDQVLLRPSLMHSLQNIQILDRDGYRSLRVSEDGGHGRLTDHLPILFQLDV